MTDDSPCYLPTSSLDDSVSHFNSLITVVLQIPKLTKLKNYHTDFYSDCTSYIPISNGNVTFAPHPYQHAVTCIIDLSHSDKYNMESQSSFDLYFPDG
ncbi:hypothetical protein STEG23_002026 [Scotinomys teguina]